MGILVNYMSGDLKSKQNEGLSPSEQQMTCNRNIYTVSL
jgi:hypothetical protein